MTRHPILHRLAESLPVILALEEAGGAVAPSEIAESTGMPSPLLAYHLDVLRQSGWATRRKDGHHRLHRQAQRWLGMTGRDHLKLLGFDEGQRTGGSPAGRGQHVAEHPAQPVLRLLSWRWQVLRSVDRLKSATAREIVHELGIDYRVWWPNRTLTPMVAAGLLARDDTPARSGGPIYSLDRAGEQWLDLRMIDSIRAAG